MANEIPICDNPEVLQERTIVILGETGVGKSTLINNAALIIRFPTLNDAIRNATTFTPLIPVRGTFKGMDISDGSDSNERNEKAASRTLMPQVYRIQSGSCVFNIIDTPGMADSGGIEMDKNHVENITACLRRFKEIHAILILVNSSNNTLTNSLKSTLNELLSCLGKTAAKLISFIVTRVTHTKEMSDASDAIIKYVNSLKDNPGFNVERSNIFGFEACSFQYFMASKKGLIEEVPWEKTLNNMVYQNNRVELLDLFKKIYKCSEPYNVISAEALILAKQMQPKLSSLLSDLDQVDTKDSQDIVELKLKLLHWREKQTSLEMDKCKEELEQQKNWSDKILKSLGKVTTVTAGGVASGAATGATVGAYTGLGVLSPQAALFGGLIGGTVGGTVGLITGVSVVIRSNSDTGDPQMDKLIEIIRNEVAQIEQRKQKKMTKYEKFRAEQNMLCNLLQDITSYMQEHAILMTNKLGPNLDEGEAKTSTPTSRFYDNDTSDTADNESRKLIQTTSGKCNVLSPEILYGRLYAMTSLKYFGKDIASVLHKCKNLEKTQFVVVNINLDNNNEFIQEIMCQVIIN